ncbi:MAG TPA: hypothetical protein VHQ45_06260 [Gemmatimonadaceae bacterium]|nr:hypothetical protein [Gemmatimonadaceae bacterium]
MRRSLLRAALLAVALLPLATAGAQSPAPDSVVERFAAAVTAARLRFVQDSGRLWGQRLDTIPWLGVAGQRVYLSVDPGVAGYERTTGELWTGPLPEGVAPANTALEWAGRRWAMIVLPLPANPRAATRLLLHEAAHVAQPAVLPRVVYHEGSVGADLLDRPEGRVWLLLEYRALAAALAAREAAQSSAAQDALLFRARRLALATAREREREQALDIVEGLPEYTAWRLTERDATAFARVLRADALSTTSQVRVFPYFTGPAYAFLLDARAPDWRLRVLTTPDLASLLAATLPQAPTWLEPALRADSILASLADSAALARSATAAGERYGRVELERAEAARWAELEGRRAELRARFADGPTVRLRPGALRIAFDPRGQVSLGEAGTVMTGVVWKGEGGSELQAVAGALVTPDWTELRVPLDSAGFAAGVLQRAWTWTGNGWTLTLPAGWRITAAGTSWVARPPTRE